MIRIADGSMKQPQACRPLPLFPGRLRLRERVSQSWNSFVAGKVQRNKSFAFNQSRTVEQACKWRTRFQTNKTLISRFPMKGHCQQIYRSRNSQSSGKWTDDLICYYHQPPTPSNKIRLCHYSWLVSAQYALRNIWSFEPCLCSQLLIVLFQASSMWTAAARAASPATWASWTRSQPSTGSRRTYRTSEVSTVDFWSRGVSDSDIFADESPNVSLRQKALF